MARKSSMERAELLVGGFATAKKKVVIQYQGRERLESNIMNQIKADLDSKGIKDEEVEQVDVYVKPEDNTVFYVVNGKINGSIAF